MLTIQDVHTYYGDSHVLQGVTMRVDRGTVAAVLGRNGVGKTTLCRSIVGFTQARSGRIMFNDVETTRLPPHRIAALRIGLFPQGRRIFSSLTVEENLAIAGRPGRPGPFGPGEWTLEKAFEVFPPLAERRRNRGNQLSGG